MLFIPNIWVKYVNLSLDNNPVRDTSNTQRFIVFFFSFSASSRFFFLFISFFLSHTHYTPILVLCFVSLSSYLSSLFSYLFFLFSLSHAPILTLSASFSPSFLLFNPVCVSLFLFLFYHTLTHYTPILFLSSQFTSNCFSITVCHSLTRV